MNCHNGENFLREAIDSVYRQSYKNWEIIFWDNASTDSSSSIAQSYDPKVRYFISNKKTSLGLARNQALGKANGKYIAFLDCDDIYMPEKIKVQVSKMQLTNAALSYGSWIKINGEGQEIKEYKCNEHFGDVFDSLFLKYNVNFQTLMINKQVVDASLLTFDASLTFSPDYKLVMLITYSNKNILVISDFLSKYRVHDEALSRHSKKEKYIEFSETTSILRKLMNCSDSDSDFNIIVDINKYKMMFKDSLEENNFFMVLIYSSKVIFLTFIKLLKKFIPIRLIHWS